MGEFDDSEHILRRQLKTVLEYVLVSSRLGYSTLVFNSYVDLRPKRRPMKRLLGVYQAVSHPVQESLYPLRDPRSQYQANARPQHLYLHQREELLGAPTRRIIDCLPIHKPINVVLIH
jgi:hypothetical protein